MIAVSASAAPVDNTPVPIVAYSADGPNADGSYVFTYETGNGIKVEEHGQLKQVNDTNSVVVVQGSFTYPNAEGSPVALTYVADENGFQPQGEHLPTPHPIPAAILKALEYIAAHPEQDSARWSTRYNDKSRNKALIDPTMDRVRKFSRLIVTQCIFFFFLYI